MKTYLECVPCFVRQALDTARRLSCDDSVAERILRRVLMTVAEMRMDRQPPYTACEIHRIIREETGLADPYADLKEESTETALRLLDGMQRLVQESPDPFEAAVRFSIAGNAIDFGIVTSMDDIRIEENFTIALEKQLARSDLPQLKETAERAESVLIVGDNAGETVFDIPLLEVFSGKNRMYAVRGNPVINDATRSDAVAAGIDRHARIIENGSDAPGTLLEFCSDEFLEAYNHADLVIAKGQGNFETLYGEPREIYFLTQVKCPVIGRDIDADVGDWIVFYQHGRPV